jgi:pimeloyl-ACP methyl ester carboxylesterase
VPFVTTQQGVDIYYKDWGPKDAQPIVFHHGWPLTADDWDGHMLFFLRQSYRVVAHDRRGHGRSSQTDTCNEMDTLCRGRRHADRSSRPAWCCAYRALHGRWRSRTLRLSRLDRQ